MNQLLVDEEWMRCALELARRGLGRVEPNPMVGCVLVRENRLIGEGWHARFGGPHAEVHAIADANQSVAGCTAYVTLEPCSHMGQTPPCAEALIAAGVARVVVAHPDPHPLVSGAGLERLREAGIDVSVGLLQSEAAYLLAPYLKRTRSGYPWVIAKWAMTWDGKIATATGDSQWISNERSRQIVHQIRGRVDAIMVGANTVFHDDPLLTARPGGSRLATRVVLDSRARIGLDSQLCRTAREFPTLIAVGPEAESQKLLALEAAGCEIWQASLDSTKAPVLTLTDEDSDPGAKPQNLSGTQIEIGSQLETATRAESTMTVPAISTQHSLEPLLRELSRRGVTNVLAEGGGELLGSLFDLRQIDEVHVFIGGKLLGGRSALTPIGGQGAIKMALSQAIQIQSVNQLDNDVYLIGRT